MFIDEVLQSGQTTGNGTVFGPVVAQQLTLYVIGSAGVSAGAIQWETADDPNYAGTWATLGTAVTVVASTELISRVLGPLSYIRARISTNIVGGTASARVVGV